LVNSAICRELFNMLPGRVRAGVLMKEHTSWRIGGPSELFVEPADREELQLVVSFARERDIPLTVIGFGTNLLVSDSGIKGIVIKTGRGLSRILTGDCEITAESGAKLTGVAAAARDAGFGGFEFSAGIPGAVGGALVMNAGANGSSIGALVRDVLLLDLEGRFYRRNNKEMEFDYRSSILLREHYIVVEASFSLYPRDKNEIKSEMAEFIRKRRTTQPLSFPSAGSVFKNPAGESAGRLIEMAGLKGMRIGDAQISTLHANFIVNLGSATARDVLALIDRTRETVRNQIGVELKLEVKFIGE